MAHKKSGGAKARQGSKPAGKRLGVKLYAGQKVKAGNIIIRQRGTKFFPGVGADLGRDHTIYSKAEGVINIRIKAGKKYVDVVDKEKNGSCGSSR